MFPSSCRLLTPAVLAVAIAGGPVQPTTVVTTITKAIAPGVALTQTLQTYPPLIVDVLAVDAGRNLLEVGPQPANGSLTNATGDIRKGRENVAAFVSRTGAIAAVNGDYFPYTGDPLGLGITDGEIYSEPYKADDGTGRAAIGWLPSGRVIVGIPTMQARLIAADGTAIPITGIDRLTSTTDPGDVCLITPRFGPTSGARGLGTELIFRQARLGTIEAGVPTAATLDQITSGSARPAPVPGDGFVVTFPAGSSFAAVAEQHFRSGEPATVSVQIQDATPTAIGGLGGSWNRVRQAIGGGPILLRGGKVVVDDAAEHLGGTFSSAPHARTAVGQRRDGTLLIVTVDAGSALSGGCSLADLAVRMQQLGAVDSINLDGGGSTTMAVSGGVTVGYPSGTASERPVADVLTVRPISAARAELSARTVAQDTGRIDGVPDDCVIGHAYQLSLSGVSGTYTSGGSRVLWNGPVGNCGFVSQDGVLHVTASGQGTIRASVGAVTESTEIIVAPPLLPPPVPINPLTQAPATTRPDGSGSAPERMETSVTQNRT